MPCRKRFNRQRPTTTATSARAQRYAGAVIVVIGQPVLTRVDGNPVATGSAARIALTAADRGAAVQLIGKVGDDPDGEALVLALAQGHVGHVALLRDPAHRTPVQVDDAATIDEELTEPGEILAPEAARPGGDRADRPALDAGDVDLGLRYLTEFRVVVVAGSSTRRPCGLPPMPPAGTTGRWSRWWRWVAGTSRPAAGRDRPGFARRRPGRRLRSARRSAGRSDRRGADLGAAFREAVEGAGWEPAEA